MDSEIYDSDELALVDWLVDILKQMPKQHLTMLNAPRYVDALRSINQIASFVKADCPDAKIEVYFDELTGTCLCLRIIADEFNVYKVEEFCEAIEPANTMCVVPLADGSLEVGFTYEDAKVPMPPMTGDK